VTSRRGDLSSSGQRAGSGASGASGSPRITLKHPQYSLISESAEKVTMMALGIKEEQCHIAELEGVEGQYRGLGGRGHGPGL